MPDVGHDRRSHPGHTRSFSGGDDNFTRIVGNNQHPLERVWCFWLSSWETQNGKPVGVMQDLGCVGTIEEFWAYFNNISVLNVGSGTSVHVFQKGIKPTWEDPRNLKGGHISMAARSAEESSKMWLELVLALIGEHFEQGDSINGVGIDVKSKGNALKVWLNDSYDADLINGTKAQCRQLVNQNAVVSMKFVPHRILLGTMHSKEKEQKGGRRGGQHRRMQSAPADLVNFDPNQPWEQGGAKKGGPRGPANARGGRRADIDPQQFLQQLQQQARENAAKEQQSAQQQQSSVPQIVTESQHNDAGSAATQSQSQTAAGENQATFTHNPYGSWAASAGGQSASESESESVAPPPRPVPQPRRRPQHQRTFSEADAFRFVPSEPLYHHHYNAHPTTHSQALAPPPAYTQPPQPPHVQSPVVAGVQGVPPHMGGYGGAPMAGQGVPVQMGHHAGHHSRQHSQDYGHPQVVHHQPPAHSVHPTHQRQLSQEVYPPHQAHQGGHPAHPTHQRQLSQEYSQHQPPRPTHQRQLSQEMYNQVHQQHGMYNQQMNVHPGGYHPQHAAPQHQMPPPHQMGYDGQQHNNNVQRPY